MVGWVGWLPDVMVGWVGWLPDVMVGWVGRLLHEEQSDPLEELIAGDGCDGQVEEEAVQDWHGDVVQRSAHQLLLNQVTGGF